MNNTMNNEWIQKYKPKSMSDIICNREGMLKIDSWIKTFEIDKETFLKNKNNKEIKVKQKKTKQSCVLISGPHGIGKSVITNIVLEENGYNVVSIDFTTIKLSKDIKKSIIRALESNSVMDMMKGGKKKKTAILIDELEGITATNEKKCVVELQKLNNAEWYCPIIFISNNKHNKMLSDIKKCSPEIILRTPYNTELNTLINKIKQEENLIFTNIYIVEKIINHSQNDVRRLITLLQDIKDIYGEIPITATIINQYCETSKKKDVDIDLFRATENLLLKYTNVNDSLRYYETEKVLLPLMIHHNYANCIIGKTGNNTNKYETIDKIGKLISFGDVIDNYIYSDQNWNLQEIHGFYTCAAPSFYMSNDQNGLKGSLSTITFATDLNRTSIKKINKKNITNTNKCFTNMNVMDYIYLNKIVKKLIKNNKIEECVLMLAKYKNIELSHIELLLKIDKIVENKINLSLKQKKEFEKYLEKYKVI